MSGKISISKLKPHPKNNYYFTEVTGDKYEEIKRSIATYGIRDPIKITTSYTVISGHQRLRIAKDLALTNVPVEILDVDEWEAEYLLIAENVERRGQAEQDPIKKSRIASFLKEYWGVQNGGNRGNQYTKVADGQNGQLAKTTADIAETIGESEKSTRRLMKLNDLIPEIQTLVSEKKLGTTAAEQLAYLTQDEQRALLDAKGDISGTTVQDAKDYRQSAKEAKEGGEDFAEKIAKLEQEKEAAEQRAEQAERSEKIALRKLEEAESKEPEVVEKPVYQVKEVMPAEKEEELRRIRKEKDDLEARLAETYAYLRELEQSKRVQTAEEETPLYDIARTSSVLNGYLRVLVDNNRYASNLVEYADPSVIRRVSIELSTTRELARKLEDILNNENIVIIEN